MRHDFKSNIGKSLLRTKLISVLGKRATFTNCFISFCQGGFLELLQKMCLVPP